MGRRPLAPGTHGKIGSKEIGPGLWKAWARFRDLDGETRLVERTGPTEVAADANLRVAFTERRGDASEVLTRDSRIREAAVLFLERIGTKRRGTTYDMYRRRVNNEIVPALGGLRGYEVTVPRLQRYMDSLESNERLATGEPLSPNSRRNIRKALKGIMQMYVRHGALDHNPCRELDQIEGGAKQPPRAYDATETREFLRRVDADRIAKRTLLNVLIRVFFYVGCRLGESLAIRWVDLNLTAEPVKVVDPVYGRKVIPPYTVWINGSMARVKGQGLVRGDLKTSKSEALVGLPPSLVALLLFILPSEVNPYEPVFISSSGGFRCPTNVGTAIRRLRERITVEHDEDDQANTFDFINFTSHIGRKSYGTALDESGQSGRQIADALRKASVTDTLNTYMGRRIVNPEAAALIESYFTSEAS